MAGLNASGLSWDTANNVFALGTRVQTVGGVVQEAMIIYPGGNTTDMLNAVPPAPCDIVSVMNVSSLTLTVSGGASQQQTQTATGTFRVNRTGYYWISIPKISGTSLDIGLSGASYAIQLRIGSAGNSALAYDSRHFVPVYAAQFFGLGVYTPLTAGTSYTCEIQAQQIANSTHGGGTLAWTSVLVQPLAFQSGTVPGTSSFVTT
jgi:hypothetical protein